MSYFFVDKGHEPQWVTKACYAVFCLAAVYGSVIAANRAWDLGDTGLGLIVWINYLFLLLSCPVAIKLLRDYERQQKLGLDPVFDPDQFKGVKGFEHVDMSLWREIRDKFKSGQLKNRAFPITELTLSFPFSLTSKKPWACACGFLPYLSAFTHCLGIDKDISYLP